MTQFTMFEVNARCCYDTHGVLWPLVQRAARIFNQPYLGSLVLWDCLRHRDNLITATQKVI
jgi:hypothetical protein